MIRQFGDGYIAKQVQYFQQQVELAMKLLLQEFGEELVAFAKDTHTYTDRTGNLTNSISYAIVRKKEILYYNEVQREEANAAALKVAMKMAESLSDAYSLIIVAGMNYAAFVESRGYNVILPAELKAKKEFTSKVKPLIDQVNKRAVQIFGSL
ncbi:MAG: hypothetical protein Q4D28_06020 [Prevotellaceae bacterium]|nr:hypothetical protein [Prevotellaceae bacterium]